MLSYPIWKVQSHSIVTNVTQIALGSSTLEPHCPSCPPPRRLQLACTYPTIFLAFLECVRPGVEKVNFVKRVTTSVTVVTLICRMLVLGMDSVAEQWECTLAGPYFFGKQPSAI